jgi:transposase InsO family protein
MHQYNVGVSFEIIAINVAGPFPLSDQGNRYLLIAMDYFSKRPEAYATPNQEAPTIAEALVTNFFCRVAIPRELHSDQGRNFESHLLQEILQRLGVSKTRTTPLHTQSYGMVERYIKTVEEQLRKVVGSDQRDWDERLPLFLLAYRASSHETTGLTPARLVFGRELQLPCHLLFRAPPDEERPTTNHSADLVDHVHDIHNYVRQHLKLASYRMKTRYDKLAKSAGYQEGDRVWLYRPTRTKGKSPKLQSSWNTHTRY